MSAGSQFRDALGYDRKKLGWYRDFALSCTGGLLLLFGLAFATESNSSPYSSAIDGRIAIGCFLGMVLCVIVSPNRAAILAGEFASIAGLTLLRLITGSFDWKLFVLYIAMMVLIGMVAVGAGVAEYFRSR